ncbi:MAG: MBL fold metallo-hydrolase [Patescibacteria group bacterium]|nr:MBL fold metallo-hydrolase [Patescibacteria group bacterium]
MQIDYFGNGDFKIKTKKGEISLGEKIKVYDFSVDGPGEYEVGGTEIECFDGITLLCSEDMNIVYLDQRKKELSDEELDRIDDVDIAFVPIGGDKVFDPKEAMSAINDLDPAVVIPMYYQDASAFSKLEGVSPENLDSLKIAKSNINQEERKVYILNAKTK